MTALEDLKAEIDAAVADYRQFFPEPYALSPNLDLAVRAFARAEAAEAKLAALEAQPDWEYRWAHADGEHAWPFGPSDEEEAAPLAEVQAAPLRDPEPEYFDGTHIERRTPAVQAGPWEPVPDTRSNT